MKRLKMVSSGVLGLILLGSGMIANADTTTVANSVSATVTPTVSTTFSISATAGTSTPGTTTVSNGYNWLTFYDHNGSASSLVTVTSTENTPFTATINDGRSTLTGWQMTSYDTNYGGQKMDSIEINSIKNSSANSTAYDVISGQDSRPLSYSGNELLLSSGQTSTLATPISGILYDNTSPTPLFGAYTPNTTLPDGTVSSSTNGGGTTQITGNINSGKGQAAYPSSPGAFNEGTQFSNVVIGLSPIPFE